MDFTKLRPSHPNEPSHLRQNIEFHDAFSANHPCSDIWGRQNPLETPFTEGSRGTRQTLKLSLTLVQGHPLITPRMELATHRQPTANRQLCGLRGYSAAFCSSLFDNHRSRPHRKALWIYVVSIPQRRRRTSRTTDFLITGRRSLLKWLFNTETIS